MKEENDPTGTTQKSSAGTPQIHPHTLVISNPVVSCRIEGSAGAVLFNPDTDTTVLINPTGLDIWTYLATPHTIQETTGHLVTIYDGVNDDAAVMQDVVQFLSMLGPDFITEVDTGAR